MGQKNYSLISGIIFAIVALVHLARLVQAWQITINGMAVPMSISWLGLIIGAILAFYGLRYGTRKI